MAKVRRRNYPDLHRGQGSWFGRWAKEVVLVASAGKIGRNDPCPCGSGKKYKQCCQRKTHAISSTAWIAIVAFAVAALAAFIFSFNTTTPLGDARCPPGQVWNLGHDGSPLPHCHG